MKVYGFTAKSTGVLRVLTSEIFISQPFLPSKTVKQPPVNKYIGIWDTGATNSVITQNVVDDCHLKPIGMTRVSHCDGVSIVEVFLVNIALPNGLGIAHLRVTKGKLVGDANALIGMDVISQGDFCISNFNQKTWYTFRIPSVEAIDFKGHSTPPTPLKNTTTMLEKSSSIGRNAPCPCGSGKKYKKCCGK